MYEAGPKHSEKIYLGGVKAFADGSLGSSSALFYEVKTIVFPFKLIFASENSFKSFILGLEVQLLDSCHMPIASDIQITCFAEVDI